MREVRGDILQSANASQCNSLLNAHYLGAINTLRFVSGHRDAEGAVAVYGRPVRGNSRFGLPCVELMRLYNPDDYTKGLSPLSRFLSTSLKTLSKEIGASIPLVVSYADPDAGHAGTIYKATNWLYTGLSAPGGPSFIIIDGTRFHPRKVNHIFGHCSPQRLRTEGYSVEVIKRIRKHVYYYPLTRHARSVLVREAV